MTNLERRIAKLEQEAGAGDDEELILVKVVHYCGNAEPTITEEWRPRNPPVSHTEDCITIREYADVGSIIIREYTEEDGTDDNED